jgi:hypothetical protein
MFQHRHSDTLAIDYHPLFAAMTTEEKARSARSTTNMANNFFHSPSNSSPMKSRWLQLLDSGVVIQSRQLIEADIGTELHAFTIETVKIS